MRNRDFSDEELVAFLDGETEFAPVNEIALALKTDAKLAARLETLRVDTHQIADSFKSLEPATSFMPDIPLTQRPEKPYKMPYQMVAASALIALTVGFGSGFALNSTNGVDTWQEYAAAYHYLYTTKTLSTVNRTQNVMQEELARVSSAVDKSLTLDQLKVSPEIEYKRAQVLGFEGKALIQLAFLTSTGEPLALCIIRSETAKDFKTKVQNYEGMSSVIWANDGYEYILIGGTNEPLIVRAAEKLSEQIEQI